MNGKTRGLRSFGWLLGGLGVLLGIVALSGGGIGAWLGVAPGERVGVEDREGAQGPREVEPGDGGPGVIPARETDRASPLGEGAGQVRVVNLDGDPIQGAEVSVTELTNDVTGHYWNRSDSQLLFLIQERTRRIREGSILSASDEYGRANLGLPAGFADSSGWVVWASAPGYAPGSQVGEAGEAPDGLVLVLEPEVASVARVVDEQGQPVPDARVWLQGDLPLPDQDPEDVGRLARRALVRVGAADAAGRVALPGAGLESTVWATRGELVAAPVRRSGPGDVELVLGQTFELRCTVRGVDGAGLGPWAVVTAFAIEADGAERLLAAADCPLEGVRGVRVPLVDGAAGYGARLRFGGVEACVQRFEAPAAGGVAEVEFSLRPGIAYWYQAQVYGEQELGIEGASLEFRWQREGEEPQMVGAKTDHNGWARVIGLPIGMEFDLEAICEGFAQLESRRPALGVEDFDQGESVYLQRAGRLRLRVTRGGEPVNGCSFGIWDDHRSSVPLYFMDVAGEDGWHVLEPVPAYRGTIQVVDWKRPLSAPVSLEFTDVGEVLEIEIELAEQAPLVGRVVDEQTGGAIEGARVFLSSFSPGGRWVVVSAEPLRTGADGRFETTYASGSRAGVQLFAPDNDAISASVVAELNGSGAFDFGDVPLGTEGSHVLQLEALDGDPDWTTFSGSEGEHRSSRHRVNFDAEGQAALPIHGSAPSATIRTPRGLHLAVRSLSVWATSEPLTVPLHVEDRLWLEALDVDGQPVHMDGSVRFYYLTDRFHADGIVRISEPGKRVAIPRPAGARVFLQWGAVGDDRLAVAEVEWDGAGDVEATLRFSGLAALAQVLDAAGQPAVGVRVQVMSTRLGSTMGAVRDTDAEGRLRLDWLPEDPLVLLYRPKGGVHYLGAQGAPPALGDSVVWTFDPAFALRGLVRDGAGPVPFARVDLRVSPRDILVSTARSTARGRLDVESLGAGDYRAVIRAPGRFPVETSVRLPGPEREFLMRRTGGIQLTVADSELAGAEVRLRCLDLGESLGDWRRSGRLEVPEPELDGMGQWRIDGIPNGTYELEIGGESARCTVTPGELAEVRIGEG